MSFWSIKFESFYGSKWHVFKYNLKSIKKFSIRIVCIITFLWYPKIAKLFGRTGSKKLQKGKGFFSKFLVWKCCSCDTQNSRAFPYHIFCKNENFSVMRGFIIRKYGNLTPVPVGTPGWTLHFCQCFLKPLVYSFLKYSVKFGANVFHFFKAKDFKVSYSQSFTQLWSVLMSLLISFFYSAEILSLLKFETTFFIKCQKSMI